MKILMLRMLKYIMNFMALNSVFSVIRFLFVERSRRIFLFFMTDRSVSVCDVNAKAVATAS